MIAAWMMHAALAGAVVCLAAVALDRAMRMLRRPARFIWLGALVACFAIPAIRVARTSVTAARLARWQQGEVRAVSSAPVDAVPSAAGTGRVNGIPVPRGLAALDRPLAIAWVGGSMLWGLVLLGSARQLRRRQSAWKPDVVDGHPIYVSHDVGPALFGLWRYSLVVPAWVLSLAARERRLVLVHDREHAQAADPVVLAAGAVLVLLQPWNPAVWWLFQRLRFAVEADCDARVLASSPDLRAYGELLLDMSERTLAGAAPLAALSEPHSHLGKRVTLMMMAPVQRAVARSCMWLLTGAGLLAGAWLVPQPAAAQDRKAERAVVHITSVGVHDAADPFTVLVFADGPARFGVDGQPAVALTDTLRLNRMPAMTVDVTEGNVHLRLLGGGTINIGGDVTGGAATHVTARGREIVLLKGGTGVRSR